MVSRMIEMRANSKHVYARYSIEYINTQKTDRFAKLTKINDKNQTSKSNRFVFTIGLISWKGDRERGARWLRITIKFRNIICVLCL